MKTHSAISDDEYQLEDNDEDSEDTKLSVLQVQEQLVRYFLGPAATTTEPNVPHRPSLSLTARPSGSSFSSDQSSRNSVYKQ